MKWSRSSGIRYVREGKLTFMESNEITGWFVLHIGNGVGLNWSTCLPFSAREVKIPKDVTSRLSQDERSLLLDIRKYLRWGRRPRVATRRTPQDALSIAYHKKHIPTHS